ncbi:hypothetical protein [Sphingobacterium bambusae]|uniref:DUF2798 domain-containing protein n=1 Tax=Sphingobacterium bambusae TaxID=662858 RepID=A0ABW6BI13_9SPHI|nr:hypothetical protein [Sphingobacterium bambusae]WPL50117.1 hypothetical protein SCB77_06595 [Sphingobacterium bambusae]
MKLAPRLKASLCIWLGLFPLSVIINFLLKDLMVDFHPIGKIFVSSIIIFPLMVYYVIPWTTKQVSRLIREK